MGMPKVLSVSNCYNSDWLVFYWFSIGSFIDFLLVLYCFVLGPQINPAFRRSRHRPIGPGPRAISSLSIVSAFINISKRQILHFLSLLSTPPQLLGWLLSPLKPLGVYCLRASLIYKISPLKGFTPTLILYWCIGS